jgi:ribosomal-protein-alanine N-acetyltransferase
MLVARAIDEAANGVNPEQRLAGFLAARIGACELHINNVAVREIYRQNGIGAALLERALQVGSERGARGALLEVRAANVAAQSLYLRQGFSITGRRKNYYAAPLDDALLMSAEI